MFSNKKLIFILFVLLSVISLLYDVSLRKEESVQKSNVEESYYVTLDGAFNKTGKCTFKKGDTIQTIVDDIGVKSNANLKAVNLSKKLIDEESIYLPVKSDLCININTASIDELEQLDRVGEKTAQKIIDYRSETRFTKIEDIQNVSGIGEKTFINLRDHICL